MVNFPCLPPLCTRSETRRKELKLGGSTKQAFHRGSETVLSPCLGMELRLKCAAITMLPKCCGLGVSCFAFITLSLHPQSRAACCKRCSRGTAALLVDITPAKPWEDEPGKECAEGSAGKDEATWGTGRPLQSQVFCAGLHQLILNWKSNKGRIRTQLMF